MNQSESIDQIVPAFLKTLAQLENLPRDAVNPYYQSGYTKLDTTLDVLRPAFALNGLGITQWTTSEIVDSHYYVGVETVVFHESGQWLSGRYVMPVEKRKAKGAPPEEAEPTAQTAAGAVTIARRYALSALAFVASEDDLDGNQVEQGTRAAGGNTGTER